ncbi:MAG: 3-phosphoshikimate 1-carboxyvinyltransferase [Flavobacteriaceae bacterium]|nr:3-phosphoshikimate 1-carboxyvinyltransferase [Flavobacteriaceae bacterium]
MQIFLKKSKISAFSELKITGSKSESNRVLLLQALYEGLTISNLSNSDDSQLMQKAIASKDDTVDIHHAGTAMRFLTTYFATRVGKSTTLTGSERMQERPIKILVDALNSLGASISYTKKEGYPPLLIQGKALSKIVVRLKANVSSQYISALLLIAPTLQHGLTLHLEGEITSTPYIDMTLSLLSDLGVQSTFESNTITVQPFSGLVDKKFTVESDWSSASYFYSIVALSPVGTQINISAYKPNSLQGDAVLKDIYQKLGVESTFESTVLSLKKANTPLIKKLTLDLANAPDIAQTIAVTCLGLQLDCDLTGLHTLKIKETDRLVALQNEIKKLGTSIEITNDSLHLKSPSLLRSGVHIATYNDHRMAMAFAPLALKTTLYIDDAEVVSKSYPDFWKDLSALGFEMN